MADASVSNALAVMAADNSLKRIIAKGLSWLTNGELVILFLKP
jgi:hypothetical protein